MQLLLDFIVGAYERTTNVPAPIGRYTRIHNSAYVHNNAHCAQALYVILCTIKMHFLSSGSDFSRGFNAIELCCIIVSLYLNASTPLLGGLSYYSLLTLRRQFQICTLFPIRVVKKTQSVLTRV